MSGELYLKSLRLKNIQSWKDLKLDFTSGLNVLEARNESGKSVPVKVIRAMLVPNFFSGEMNRTLIRRKEEVGEAWWEYEDFTVKFEIYPTYQVYRLLSPTGEEIESWNQNTFPTKLKKMLSLYSNEENSIILNVIDLELGLLFDSTDSKYNASVVNFYAEDTDLTKSLYSLTQWTDDIITAKRRENVNYQTLEQLSEIHKYVDLDSFKDNLESREKLCKTLDFFINLGESFEVLSQSKSQRFVIVNEESLSAIISTINSLMDISKSLTDFIEIFNSRKKFIEANADDIQTLLLMIDSLKGTSKTISNFIDVIKARKSFVHTDINYIQNLIDNRLMFVDISKNLNNLLIMNSKRKTFNQADDVLLNSIVDVLSCLSKLDSYTNILSDTLAKRKTLANYISRIDNKLDNVKSELGVCPLCDTPFNIHNKEGC